MKCLNLTRREEARQEQIKHTPQERVAKNDIPFFCGRFDELYADEFFLETKTTG